MTTKSLLNQFAIGITFMLATTATVLAQSTEGSIRGTVVDPAGALVPQAQVIISNATGFSRTITSSATGAFELPHLVPGNYAISINANGFTPALDGVQVVSHKVTNETVKLGISVSQEVDVFANDDDTINTPASR